MGYIDLGRLSDLWLPLVASARRAGKRRVVCLEYGGTQHQFSRSLFGALRNGNLSYFAGAGKYRMEHKA